MWNVPDRFHADDKYVGYRDDDNKHRYARFFENTTAPVQPHVPDAIFNGPVPLGEVTPLEQYGESIARQGYLPMETGWAVLPDGGVHVAVLTRMPRVKAHMWDWWFSWHGTDPSRYKLWHPESHFYATWADNRGDLSSTDPKSYIGRTSLIDEYVGGILLQGSVRFVDPAELSVDAEAFDGTVICGRAGGVMNPVEYGWLMHQVRNTSNGAEMRSRFYLGTAQSLRAGLPDDVAQSLKREGLPPPGMPHAERFAMSLLYHCAQEMNHLGRFLPELYEEFGDGR